MDGQVRGAKRSGSLASTAGSADTRASTDTRASDKVTTVSVQSDWETPLQHEASLVSLNPWNLFLACRNAKIVTIEPVVFLYMLGTYLYFPLYQQYYYLRFGLDQLRGTDFPMPNESFCLNSSEVDDYGGRGSSKIVQTLCDNLLTYGSVANRLLSIVATLIMGPLSDRYGRRIIILIVATGMLFQGVLSLFIVYFNLSVYLFILGQALTGLTGDFASIIMACFTYVVDVGSLRWRTLRIAIAEGMLFFAGAIGEGLVSGLWLQKLDCNFIPPLWLYVACALGILGYTLALLPESLSRTERQQHKKQNICETMATGFKIFFCQFQDYAVWKLWGGILVTFVIVTNMTGSVNMSIYYFKQKASLDWDPEITGFYLGAEQISNMIGLLVVLPLLMACRAPDALIAIIGLAVHLAKNVFTGLAWTTYQFFIIAAVEGFQAIMLPPLRSIMSKVVPDDKQGAIFSVVASVELFSTFVAGLAYPQIFNFTLNHDLPIGTIYFIMSVMTLIPIPILLLLLFCKKRTYLFFPATRRDVDSGPLKSHPYSVNEEGYHEKDPLISSKKQTQS